MNDIDKFCADQCDVELNNEGMVVSWPGFGTTIADVNLWTIQDPRCREIVREHFRIEMCRVADSWIAFQYLIEEDASIEGHGKTIAEAECNCIQQIYEASK